MLVTLSRKRAGRMRRRNGCNPKQYIAMSQITEKNDAIQIEGFSLSRCQDELASFVELRSHVSMKSMIPELKKHCSVQVVQAQSAVVSKAMGANSPALLSSPNMLHRSFRQSFTPRVDAFQKQGLSSIEAKKASALCALSELDFTVSKASVAVNHFQAAFAADTETLVTESLRSGFQELEHAHTKLFTSAVAHACARASVISGFPDVTIKPLPQSECVLVIAKNQSGQGLVSEISVNKMQQINTATEVIGIHDGSCEGVINRFNAEIKRLGVKFSSDSTRPTRGTVQNGANLAEKQKHEVERTRKLNQQRRAQH